MEIGRLVRKREMDLSFQFFSPLVADNVLRSDKKKYKDFHEVEDGSQNGKGLNLAASKKNGSPVKGKKQKRKKPAAGRDDIGDGPSSQASAHCGTQDSCIPHSNISSETEVDKEIFQIATNIKTCPSPSGSEVDLLDNISGQTFKMATPKRKRVLEEVGETLSPLTKRMRGDPMQVPLTSTQIQSPRKRRASACTLSDSDLEQSQSILAGASPWKPIPKQRSAAVDSCRRSPDLFSTVDSDSEKIVLTQSPKKSPKKRLSQISNSPVKAKVSPIRQRSASQSHAISDSDSDGTSSSGSDDNKNKTLSQKLSQSRNVPRTPLVQKSRSPPKNENSPTKDTNEKPSVKVSDSDSSGSDSEPSAREATPPKWIMDRTRTPKTRASPKDSELSSGSDEPSPKRISTPPPREMRYKCPNNAVEIKRTEWSFTRDDLGPNKEIWCIRVPRNFDVQSLAGKRAEFNTKVDITTEIEGKTSNYQLHSQQNHERNQKKSLLCVDDNENALRLGGYPVSQLWLTQTETIPSPRRPHPRPFRDTKLPPGLKRRYIPFGTGAVTSVKKCDVVDGVEERMADNPDVSPSGVEEPLKRKKKKKKKNRGDIEAGEEPESEAGQPHQQEMDAALRVEDIPEEIIPETQGQKKKKKKRRREKEDEEDVKVSSEVDTKVVTETPSETMNESESVKKKKKKKKSKDREDDMAVVEETPMAIETEVTETDHSKKKHKKKHKSKKIDH